MRYVSCLGLVILCLLTANMLSQVAKTVNLVPIGILYPLETISVGTPAALFKITNEADVSGCSIALDSSNNFGTIIELSTNSPDALVPTVPQQIVIKTG